MSHELPPVLDSLQHSPAMENLVQHYFNESFWELFFLGIVGALLHILLKIKQARDKGQTVDTVAQLFNLGISILIVGVLVYIRDEMVSIFPMTKLIVLGVGYSAQSMFLNIVSLARKKVSNEQVSPADPESGTP